MITDEQRLKFYEAVGLKAGKKILNTIAELRPFVEWSETDDGKWQIGDDIENMGRLMNKIFESLIKDGTAGQSDVCTLQYIHKRIKKIAIRSLAYQQFVEKVQNPNAGNAVQKV